MRTGKPRTGGLRSRTIERRRRAVPLPSRIGFWALTIGLYAKLGLAVGVGERKRFVGNKPVKESLDGVVEDTAFLDGVILVAAASIFLANLRAAESYTRTLVLGGLLVLLAAASSVVNDIPPIEGFTNAAKALTPLAILPALFIYSRQAPWDFRNACWLLLGTCLALVVYGILTLPPEFNKGRTYLPAYFANLHTSAHVVLASILLAWGLAWRTSRRAILHQSLILVIGGGFLAVAWGVRTSIAGLVVASAVFYLRNQPHLRPKAAFLATFTVAIGLVWSIASGWEVSLTDIDEFASGRLDMYTYKAQEFADRDLRHVLFGRGYGSDLAVTRTWWWGEKDSHNDYIKLTGELGLLFIAFFIAILRDLIRRHKDNSLYLAIWAAYLVSCGISNGFISRPLATYVLMFGVALAALGPTPQRREVPVQYAAARRSFQRLTDQPQDLAPTRPSGAT